MTNLQMDPAILSAAPREDRLELDLSEMFHRKKRTLMLLASSVILLGCAPEVGQTVEAIKTAIGQPHPASGALRFSLLVAASYYAWGFFHEVLAAVRVNKDRMDSSQLAEYEREVEAFVARMRTEANSMAQVMQSMKDFAETLPTRLTDALACLAPPLDVAGGQAAPKTDRPVPAIGNAVKSAMAAIYPAASKDPHLATSEGIAQVAAGISALETGQRLLAERLSPLTETAELAAKRIRLNKRIYIDRWMSFWIWEVGASAAVYMLAVLFTFTSLGFEFGALVNSWVAHASTPPRLPS